MNDISGQFSSHLEDNIAFLQKTLPLDTSFDLIHRDLFLGDTRAYWLGINGFCRLEILQQIFSDLQNPLYTADAQVQDIVRYMNSKLGYAQASLSTSPQEVIRSVLSGPSVLFIDGFSQAILIDVRGYPTRGVEEPEAEKITKGSRDGFVETLLFNANLIRRRVRSPQLTFAIQNVGTESQTDVAIAYLADTVDRKLLDKLTRSIRELQVTSLTMGTKSLEELLIKKKWFHPLPGIRLTERPDVACSFLLEGHILILVDNTPSVMVLPGSFFHFLQSPEDYYKGPLIGSYFRLIRLLCIPVNLLLLPLLLVIGGSFPELAEKLQLFSSEPLTPMRLFFYVTAVEFLLDLLKYGASLTSGNFSGTLSLVSGLIIGDVAVNLKWASTEVLFYAALTMLASLSIASIELADALRVYRIFLVLVTGFFGVWGFGICLFLILLSAATTPTFGGMSYFWPLIPFNGPALRSLLFRSSTFRAQPSRVWKREVGRKK